MAIWLAILSLASVLVTSGCGSNLSNEDLGHVVFERPKIKGADRDYPLPQLVLEKGDKSKGAGSKEGGSKGAGSQGKSDDEDSGESTPDDATSDNATPDDA